MRNFRKHKTTIFLIASTLVIAVLIGIFGAVASKETASLAENAVGVTAEGGQEITSGIGGWFRNIFSYFGSVKKLREENEALKKMNIELDKQVKDMLGLEYENEDLRAMLGLAETEPKLDLVAARVIAKDPSNWYSSFTINKGTKDGIEKNQAVFTGNGELLGQVYKVGSSWAEIITVLDPDSSVGSAVGRTNDIGVLEGDYSLRLKGLCRLGYLSRDAEIAVGDYVETSGMGGIYPKGLLIGKVTEVIEENATMSKYATVEPLANIDKVNEVFVLRTFTEEIKLITRPDDGTREDEEEVGNEEEEDVSSESSESKPEPTKSVSEPSSKPAKKPTVTEKPSNQSSSTSQGSPAVSDGGGSQNMSGMELME